MNVTLYHNPRCSKSRKTRELLEQNNITFDTVEYLTSPLDADGLRRLVALLGDDVSVADIVRSGEKAFSEQNLDLDQGDALFDAIAAHPILMQRPIVIAGDRAAIGRPPEAVLALFDSR